MIGVASAAEEADNGGEAAPEPYSYSYETDTHSASESKDASGKVTGYYTIGKCTSSHLSIYY